MGFPPAEGGESREMLGRRCRLDLNIVFVVQFAVVVGRNLYVDRDFLLVTHDAELQFLAGLV